MSSSPPTLRFGSSGPYVVIVQDCLDALPLDGDFGSITREAVEEFQRQQNLTVDGIVGPMTWDALDDVYDLPDYPPPLPEPLDPGMITLITNLAAVSQIARYAWKDRGVAPPGYIKGMALAFSTVARKWKADDDVAKEMAKANTRDSDVDALSWYKGFFDDLGMSNETDGIDTLRHLFVLQLGLGMRESSGQYCCGRDQSADNTDSMTCEAGLFQTSWNASGCSPYMQVLFDQYDDCPPLCARDVFEEGVSCSSSDWSCYGSGDGYRYQEMAKQCPQFAVETTAIGLRNLRQHWGPLNRYEVELRLEADDLLQSVQDLITNIPTV